MNIREYQNRAKETAIYPEKFSIMYPTLGLVGEAGEIANKVKKIYRDNNGEVTDEFIDAIKSEIGDVLWYCAALASDLKIDLAQIAEDNISKLNKRMETDTLKGSGDNRERVVEIISDIQVFSDDTIDW